MTDARNKLSIISMSGDFDKAIAVFTLASGAAAINYEVNLFFTFWGLDIIKKKRGRNFIGKGVLARAFNFLLGGRDTLPLSRLNFAGLSPVLMTGLMKSRNVATLQELYDASVALGVNFYACEMAMHVLGLERSDFVPEVKDVLGVANFLELSKGGQTLFI
jgi:peroxiredoxin family protein